MFRIDDVKGIIRTFIGEEGIKEIAEVDGWKEFDRFAEVVVKAYNEYIEASEKPNIDLKDLQEKIMILDKEIDVFLKTVTLKNQISFHQLFGTIAGKNPNYIVYSFSKVVLLLAIFVKLWKSPQIDAKKIELQLEQ